MSENNSTNGHEVAHGMIDEMSDVWVVLGGGVYDGENGKYAGGKGKLMPPRNVNPAVVLYTLESLIKTVEAMIARVRSESMDVADLDERVAELRRNMEVKRGDWGMTE